MKSPTAPELFANDNEDLLSRSSSGGGLGFYIQKIEQDDGAAQSPLTSGSIICDELLDLSPDVEAKGFSLFKMQEVKLEADKT